MTALVIDAFVAVKWLTIQVAAPHYMSALKTLDRMLYGDTAMANC